MADRELLCKKCGKPIVSQKDLVVTNRLFTRFCTYHKECFQAAYKNGDYTGRPANTPAATISLGIVWLAALILYLYTRDLLVLLVVAFSPIYRLLIWFRFERLLKK